MSSFTHSQVLNPFQPFLSQNVIVGVGMIIHRRFGKSVPSMIYHDETPALTVKTVVSNHPARLLYWLAKLSEWTSVYD